MPTFGGPARIAQGPERSETGFAGHKTGHRPQSKDKARGDQPFAQLTLDGPDLSEQGQHVEIVCDALDLTAFHLNDLTRRDRAGWRLRRPLVDALSHNFNHCGISRTNVAFES